MEEVAEEGKWSKKERRFSAWRRVMLIWHIAAPCLGSPCGMPSHRRHLLFFSLQVISNATERRDVPRC
jgi:hypothetical protein